MNSWPEGKRRALTQSEHETWNAGNYPGTRQICFKCDCETGRCEDDAIYDTDGNAICEECHAAADAGKVKP